MSHKPSVKRTAANQANAQLSTGPKDTTRTRHNAVKHGLLAEGLTELDDPDAFSALLATLRKELKPVGKLEGFLVQRIALAMTRLDRAVLLEAEHITEQLNPPVVQRRGGDLDELSEQSFGKEVVTDPGIPARLGAEAVETLANVHSRYEARIEARLYRALNQLDRMQRLRRGERVPAPVNLEVTVDADCPVASFGSALRDEREP